MKWLKGFFALVAILVVVLVGVIAFVLTSIDPNSYKPELEKLAQENDIELAIDGDLGWSFYPNLAVQAGSTSLSGKKDSGIPSVKFNQAHFVLDWSALLSGTIRLNAIIIDGADIRIESSEEATNVAALPSAAASTHKPSQPTTDSTTTDLPFEFAIDELSLTNSRITLVSPDGSQQNPDQVIEQLNFTSKKLNLENEPFPISLAFSTQLPEQTNLVNLAFDSQLSLQLDPQQLQLSNAQLKLEGLNIEDKALPISLAFNAKYDGQQDSVNMTEINGKLGPAAITGEINAQQLQTTPSATGNLSVANLILSELPIEAPEGFKTVSIQTGFSASETKISLDQLKLSLDNFNIGGNFSLTLKGPRQLEMALKGDHLVLPKTDTTDSEETSTSSTSTADQAVLLTPLLAPLALLEGGKGHIELNLDSVTADNIRVDQLHLNIFTNGNVLQVANLSGSVFNGTFQATTKIDLREKTPKVKFSKQLENIDIYNALSTLAEQSDVRGRLTMDFSGTTAGDTQEVLMANVGGSGKLNVSDLHLENINVEKGYCEMAALVEKRPLGNQTWPNSTKLQNFQSDIHWRDQKIQLPGFTTGLGNLAVSGNGTVNLAEESYNMLITANLKGDKTSETGCPIKSKSIRNRDIPFRCTGSFAEDGGGSCLPDKQFINNLVKDKIKKKLFDKFLKPKEEEQLDPNQATEEETKEEPQDIKEQVIDSLLKGIFQ